MKKLNKAVITGYSVCAANGVGNAQFNTSTLEGVSGCQEIDFFDIPSNFSNVAGIIKDFFPESHFNYSTAKENTDYYERLNHIAEFCLDEAWVMADLNKMAVHNKVDLDVYIATAIGPMISMEHGFIQGQIEKKLIENKYARSYSFGEFTKRLQKKFNLNGYALTLPTGCVGGCDSIAYGLNAIRMGKSKRVLVGAVEAPITPLVVNAFGRIQATSTRSCSPNEASCPFDERRDGFVLSEGGALLILEDEKVAKERGAKIYGEISGFGSVNNCFHMTDLAPAGEYIKKSCQLALEDAGVSVNEIDYINAHASSTPQNDVAESAAFNSLFGENTKNLPVTAIKSQIGHALAAASAIEVVSVLETLSSGLIPPTINLKSQDKNCKLSVVKGAPKKVNSIRNVIKTSSGFSGIHTALIISRYDKE